MAADHSTSTARGGGNQRANPRRKPSKGHIPPKSAAYQRKAGAMHSQSPEHGVRLRIRGNLRAFLESEQDALAKTRSLLLCISNSIEERRSLLTEPYYPEIVELAAELVRRRVFNLAELLDGRLPAVVTIC